uniref:Uncharacterized protein n=1 Tax=uncultured prokaryote TaxID=198431 RepID=A0A0H5Q7G9_9ZZZZ|nr:hypothetical protein [uncultured prokaryote]
MSDAGTTIRVGNSLPLWGKRTPKDPDELLFRQISGAVAIVVREWMEQSELPF